MPNRIIRESCRTSPTLMLLSAPAERLFWRLTTVADDFGRFEADPAILRSTCYPRATNEKEFMIRAIRSYFGELIACGLVTTYDSGGHCLGFFTTWERHQRRRAQTPKYPAPTSDSICCHVLSDSPEESRNRGARNRGIEESVNVAQAAGQPSPGDAMNGHHPGFKIAPNILDALDRAPRLGATPKLRDPAWWRAEIRANRGVQFPTEVLKAEAWLTTHPERHYKRLSQFFHGWLGRADRVTETL